MIESASAVLGLIQQGLTAAQEILKMKTSTEVSIKTQEIIDSALASQQRALDLAMTVQTLQKEIESLREENRRAKAFDAQKGGYVLYQAGPHAHAYAHQQIDGSPDPLHLACVACYSRGAIQRLQFARHEPGLQVLACQACHQEIKIPHDGDNLALCVPRARTRSML